MKKDNIKWLWFLGIFLALVVFMNWGDLSEMQFSTLTTTRTCDNYLESKNVDENNCYLVTTDVWRRITSMEETSTGGCKIIYEVDPTCAGVQETPECTLVDDCTMIDGKNVDCIDSECIYTDITSETECTIASDCEGETHIDCVGDWTCEQGDCVWTCETIVCTEEEITYHTCIDGTKIEWCECVNNGWVCITSPEDSCPEVDCVIDDDCPQDVCFGSECINFECVLKEEKPSSPDDCTDSTWKDYPDCEWECLDEKTICGQLFDFD